MQINVRVRSFLAAAVLSVAASGSLIAQDNAATVNGRVTADGGSALAGVQLVATNIQTGSQYGALSGSDGRYSLALRAGTYRIAARRIGYDRAVQDNVTLAAGETRTVDFALGATAVALDAIEVFATRAVERQTPVAYTDVDKTQMEQQLGSQDIPLILNVSPSVYSTEQGGASGDARINVRGFDQRNIGVMINGVPVNDMENGWVYWSNWDGVGDATSSIQLQRGLSAVNLATPSIGGTLNIITDATQLTRGAMLKQEMGSDGFLKTTAMLASGEVNDKFAFMAQGVRKTGDGLADGIWTDAWAYYFGATYKISNSNRLDLYALGAPQRHGQRLYKQNIGAMNASFARGLSDYDPAALNSYPQATENPATSGGSRWNQNWAPVSTSYTGMQAVGSRRFQRQREGFINERENFYHKPQVNLNWFSSFNETTSLSTVAYFSGGRGGGTGTYGNFEWDYNSGPTRIADYDRMVSINSGTLDDSGNPKIAGESAGILRNSRNNQWTVGAISKLRKDFSRNFTGEVGVDWRTAEIEHYREVRDLLGGDYYIDSRGSDFWGPSEMQRRLGDKINYDFTNTVDWVGGYAQGEYQTDDFSVYGMGGVSTIKYTYINHFADDGSGNEVTADSPNIMGFQLKGGGLFNVTQELGIFVNAGYVEKVPIFDGVIDDFNGDLNPNPENEKFIAFEGGVNYQALDRALAFSANAYFMQWNDRTITRGVQLADGSDGLVSLLGLDQRHMGVEFEAAYQPLDVLRIDAGASHGSWFYTDDVSGTFRPDARNAATQQYNYYVNDLKVGDAPQTQVSLAASVYPTEGVFAQLVGRAYTRHWAAFDPLGRTDPADRAQSWEVPGYQVLDGHFSWQVPEQVRIGQDAKFFFHIYNILDETYILDALDNSRFNDFDGDHDADDAEVFFGLQRRFNAGLQFRF